MTRERLPVTTCPYCYARRTARTLPYHLNVCAQARAARELDELDAKYHDHLPEGANCARCGLDHAAINPEAIR